MKLNGIEYVRFIKNYIKNLEDAYDEYYDTFGDSIQIYNVIHEIVGVFFEELPNLEDKLHFNNNFLDVDVEICKSSLQKLIIEIGGRIEEDNDDIRFARCLYANLLDSNFITNYIKEEFYDLNNNEIEYIYDLKYWFELKYGIIYSDDNKFDRNIFIKVIELYYEILVKQEKRYDYTKVINKLFSDFYMNYHLEKGSVNRIGYLTSFPISNEIDSFNIENKMRYSKKLIVSQYVEDKKIALDVIVDVLDRLLSYYGGRNNEKMAKEIAKDDTSHLYHLFNKELDNLSKIYNSYFDIRHSEKKTNDGGEREILKDPKIIEYLYNRIFAMTYLCRFYTYDKFGSEME